MSIVNDTKTSTPQTNRPILNINNLELSEIIDSKKIKKLISEFYKLTNIGIGIIDRNGKVIVRTGRQDICTKFHQINKESNKLCLKNEFNLSREIEPGTFKKYKCPNNLCYIATPIMIGNRHIGNIFLCPFFYENDQPDYEIQS